MLYYLYVFLLGLSFVMSLYLKQHDKSFIWFKITLGIYAISEAVVLLIYRHFDKPLFFVYHITIPLTTVLICLFFKGQFKEVIIKKLSVILAGIFAITSLTLSYYSSFDRYPGMQINLMGFLIVGLSLYTLFTLDPIQGVSIFRHPMAWISLGFTVFYTGVFFFNGVYNKLRITDKKIASILHAALNHGPNCFMYLSFCIALYWSHRLYKEKAVEL